MNKLFSSRNFFIMLLAMVLGSAHLMYGNCQTSKLHYILQEHYMPFCLPNWMLKNEIDSMGYLKVNKNYSGKWLAWSKNGTKNYEIEYKDSKKNGKEIWYDGSAKIIEIEYKDGKKNGKEIRYSSGKKKIETEYKDGKKYGKYTLWDVRGKKRYESEYKDDKKNGKITQWDVDGKITNEQEFKEDEIVDF